MSDSEAASSSSDPPADMQENAAKGTDPFVEPEKKRRRISQSIDCGGVKNKLEERLGGILCCAVCLDLPKAAVYQVSAGLLLLSLSFFFFYCLMQLRRSTQFVSFVLVDSY